MVSRYSNELNAFREGIENRVAQHRDKTDAINKALGFKADKVFENAKKISDAGSKLIESGIGGGVGATAIGKYARKGITSFNKYRQAGQDIVDKVKGKVGDMEEKFGNEDVDSIAQRMKNEVFGRQSTQQAQDARDSAPTEESTEGGANQSVGGETKDGTSNLGESEQTSGDTELSEMRPVGGRQGVQVDDDTMGVRGDNARFTEETMNEGAERRGMGQEDIDAPEAPGQVKPESKVDIDDDETKAGDGSEDADAGAEEAGEAGTEAGETVGETAGEVAGDAAEVAGAEGAAEGLETAAAATSWLAWLGIPELLAAGGAIAGAVGAGIGIADAVKGGNEESKAQAMPTTQPDKGIQVAGTYVVPTMDSLS